MINDSDNHSKQSDNQSDDSTDNIFKDLSYLRKVGNLSDYDMSVSNLFTFYKDANFTYGKKEERIQKNIDLITDNWNKALKAGDKLLWVSISKSEKPDTMATISSWRSTNNSWMAQHMASSKDAPGLTSVLLNTLAQTITERKSIKACHNWYCKENRTACRFYDEIVNAIGEEYSSNTMFEYLNIDKDLETKEDESIIIERFKPEMRKGLIEIAIKTHGPIYAVAEEFDHPDIELNDLNKIYVNVDKQLGRKRYIWLAYHLSSDTPNEPVGAIICYRGPLGFNFSFFENRCDLLINTEDDHLREPIALSLLSRARQVYFDTNFDHDIKKLKYPLDYFPVVCIPSVSDSLKKKDGVESFRKYNQCYLLREGFEKYYRYLINDLETCLKYIKAHYGQ